MTITASHDPGREITVRQTFHFEGRVTQEDLARPYIYLPFTVPPRTARLEVSYQFEHPKRGDFGVSGGNNLDLGIFDARGTDFLAGASKMPRYFSSVPHHFGDPEVAVPSR